MRTDEMMRTDDTMRTVAAYSMQLRAWLAAHSVDISIPDPMRGRWILNSDGGAIDFSAGVFRWCKDRLDPDTNCHIGTYGVLPGVRLHSGFSLSRTGKGISCFTVTQHYTLDQIGGIETPVNRYGLWYVEQMGSPDTIQIYDHLTDSSALATRMT